ncbi:hypothetical protein KQX54_005708 [Cotesia glomerata]|uniref:Uncharacterized protein n=1 Tax=Cotesia glomerata TaxID=32391 RepID=A0AAV7ITI9_COTGL|nr:hypothetical protein KQX54_005708 [Cotesia glomerata]
MVMKCAGPLSSWPEYLVDIRGRANTYEEAEKRLEILEKNPYAYTTDNEKSAELIATSDKKKLKIKSHADNADKMKDLLNKGSLKFNKSPTKTDSDEPSDSDEERETMKFPKKIKLQRSGQKNNLPPLSSSNESSFETQSITS